MSVPSLRPPLARSERLPKERLLKEPLCFIREAAAVLAGAFLKLPRKLGIEVLDQKV